MSERVEFKGQSRYVKRRKKAPQQRNDLYICLRAHAANHLDAELVKLPKPPGLWTFVAKHRADVIQLAIHRTVGKP